MAITKTTLQGLNTGNLVSGLVGDVVNVGMFISDYKTARKQGNSNAVSIAKGLGSFAWGEFFYAGLGTTMGNVVSKIRLKGLAAGTLTMGLTIGASLLAGSAQVVSAMGQHTTQKMGQAYNLKGKFGSGYFNMTEAGYTMRQRSLNAIRSNGLNTQSVLGNEARTYFRGSV